MAKVLVAGLVAVVLVGVGCWNAKYFLYPEVSLQFLDMSTKSDEELKNIHTQHICAAMFYQYSAANSSISRRSIVKQFFRLYHEFERRDNQDVCVPPTPGENLQELRAGVARHIEENELWAELDAEGADPSETAARYDEDFDACQGEATAKPLSADWNAEMRECMTERGQTIE